jgi:hypothetical protein
MLDLPITGSFIVLAKDALRTPGKSGYARLIL